MMVKSEKKRRHSEKVGSFMDNEKVEPSFNLRRASSLDITKVVGGRPGDRLYVPE